MKNEVRNQTKKEYVLPVSILVAAMVLSSVWIYTTGLKIENQENSGVSVASEQTHVAGLEEKILPTDGVVLPVVWGDLGAKLVSVGAIDAEKFKAIYEQRGTFSPEYEKLLLGQNDDQLKITKENAGYLLNLFWALGLASKNDILENGEMVNPAYGGAGNFASTGGWTIAKGNPMDHYSQHRFFNLTPEQQALVDKVSRGIYRPCCGNSTHFPDCNHGMAMLGLLQLLAKEGLSETEMYDVALAVNSYWFPETYMNVARFFQNNYVEWEGVDSALALGASISSVNGYARVLSEIEPVVPQGGGGCGV